MSHGTLIHSSPSIEFQDDGVDDAFHRLFCRVEGKEVKLLINLKVKKVSDGKELES